MLPEFNIDGAEFVKALSAIGRVSDGAAYSKGQVMVEAKGGEIRLVAISPTLSAAVRLPAEVSQAGQALVKYAPLATVLNKVDGGIGVKADKGKLKFTSRLARASVEASTEIYATPSAESGTTFSIPFDELAQAVKYGGSLYSVKGAHPIFEAANIESYGGVAFIQSSNRFCLSRLRFLCGAEFKVNADGRGLQEAMRLLSHGEGDVEATVGANRLILQRGEWLVGVAVLDGEYPLLARAIDDKAPVRLAVQRKALIDALARVRVIDADGDSTWIDTHDNAISLTAYGGANRVDVEVEAECKGGYSVCVSDKQMANVLNLIPDETVSIAQTSPVTTLMIHSQNGATYGIAPINTKRPAADNE